VKEAEEAAFDNEKLCQICFNREMDTKYLPCGHTSCRVCIQTHMLNNKKCPYCNMEIEGLADLEEDNQEELKSIK